ncbi:unnamed protein product [Rangifer tarandus platyrhynchus]|uniref:Uncharacterized protein n=1 Tax=Rangifer tarandus platyrhynchus TaxID=3082113 RepID=A0ABN8Y7F7_RANTA|nr:unnamed protein product [Rangifer tarandus platyrhynchus]
MLDLLMEEKAGIMVRSDLRKNFPSDDRAAEPRSYSGLIPPSCQFPVISRGSSQDAAAGSPRSTASARQQRALAACRMARAARTGRRAARGMEGRGALEGRGDGGVRRDWAAQGPSAEMCLEGMEPASHLLMRERVWGAGRSSRLLWVHVPPPAVPPRALGSRPSPRAVCVYTGLFSLPRGPGLRS